MIESSRTFYLKGADSLRNVNGFRLLALHRVLESAADGMSEEQLKWHPEGKWCTAEVLEHLFLAFTGTIRGFERVLEAGKPLVKPATLKQRLQTFVVVTCNYLPEGRKAPEQTVPRGLPHEKIRAEVAATIAAMDEIMTRCEDRLGRGNLLDHPILGPLTAAEWRKFHLIHGRHHAKQIDRLRQGYSAGLVTKPADR